MSGRERVVDLVKRDGWRPDVALGFARDPDGFARRHFALYKAVVSVLADEIRRDHFDIDEADVAGAEERAQIDTRRRDRRPPLNDDDLLVEAWNEKAGRTQDDVLDLLNSAIARLS